MSLLLHNLTLADPFGPHGLLKDAWLLIEADMIVEAGSGDPPHGANERHDLRGALVLPSMINAHTHLYSALALGMPAPEQTPESFLQTLQRVWWRLDRALDEPMTRASFRAGLAASLRAGTGTVIDHHSSQNRVRGSLEALAEAAGELGVRVGLAFETTDRNGPEARDAALAENEWALRTCGDDPYVRPMIGLHASFTLEDETLVRVADLLAKYPGSGIHIHLAEGIEDVEDAKRRGHASPVKRLDSFGLLGESSLLIHGVHCGEEDRALLAERDVMLVHNPTSNANNRVGLPDAALIGELEAGLGTDGMQMDMLREAKEGTLIWSARSDIGSPTPDLTRMLLENNPRIASRLFGIPLGHLGAGQPADLAVYDSMPRTPLTPENVNAHLGFGPLGPPRHVMTGGRFALRDGRLQGVDEEKLVADARNEAGRLWQAMSALS